MTNKSKSQETIQAKPIDIAHPERLEIMAPASLALAQAAAHVRDGYVFEDTSITIFSHTGALCFTLVKGDPDDSMLERARNAYVEALALQQHQAQQA
ncbi:hypothetical protein GCM10027277_46790 [Pseudoduganella ginsengisoli]|uniref:Uncharacterized protein n=1 Tax=Pseudoduganella ginsengisoli TaxID=1462440 RepID=A0A6L6Q3U4_9BURK|nr:hypothetical protein [Pseudoduganella ginsengisoli]MTW04134.1 hypothetical protein [Pseudoduganella ginsengisoli]